MRSSWTVPAIALTGSALVVAVLVSPATSTPALAAASLPVSRAVSPCHAAAPTKDDGSKWTCAFFDGFRGRSLDRHKWGTVTTSKTGYHHGPECFVDRPDVIRVRRGVLRLSVLKARRPFTCGTNGKDSFEAVATAGSVTTMDTFTQTYGLYQVRAAFPGTHVPGVQSAIWLFPKKLSSALLTTDYGEIDIAEFYTKYYDRVIPALHYSRFPLVPQQWTNNNCLISHTERYHTYTVEWTPKKIAISYDGKLCLLNDNWIPMPPLAHPAPFNKPFGLILTQALGVRSNALKGDTPPPAVMKVAWVRAWR